MRKIIIQQNWGHDTFQDMMRLTYNRHAAYARAKGFDYWAINGEIHPEMYPGGWGKIWLIQDALERGFDFIAWIDADAAIVDFNTDLTEATKKPLGACEHYADWFEKSNIPRHLNVGVLYVNNCAESQKFIADWLKSYPGDRRWMEQGSFNNMAKPELVEAVDAKWNATVNVNMVDKPVVIGWHGVPHHQRFMDMKNYLINDHITYKV